MTKRKFRLVRIVYPLTAICERCEKSFASRSEDLDSARNDIENAFNAHKCQKLDASQNALRVVREATENK